MSQPVERGFINIERLVASIAAPLVGGANHTGSETPADLEAKLPFVRARRVGGERTVHIDYPIVDVSFLAVDEVTGWPAVSELTDLLLSKPHWSIDVAGCDPAPRELPWGDNENVRHWGATFFFELRRVQLPFTP